MLSSFHPKSPLHPCSEQIGYAVTSAHAVFIILRHDWDLMDADKELVNLTKHSSPKVSAKTVTNVARLTGVEGH